MTISFVMPQQQTFQEFLNFPSDLTDPLRTLIVGPRALLTRYGVANEKANGLVGPLDPLLNHAYPYPNEQAGAIIDQTYTKVFVDDALLKYWDKQIGVNGTVFPVAGHANQFRASQFAFKSNGTVYPRNAVFLDRDVQVGDVVDVRGFVGGVEYDKRTSVIGFVADTVAETVGPAVANANNAGTAVAAASSTKLSGSNNEVIISAASATSYDGSETGNVTETYTIEVTQGSIGGNFTTARLKIVSASGNDNYFPANNDGTFGVIPAASGVAFAITPRGAKITFSLNVALPTDAGVSPTDLISGQKWTLQVTQAWTAVVGTSGGVYTGTVDTTYIVTVLTGDLYADLTGGGSQSLIGPQSVASGITIQVTTTTGTDASGPTSVPAAGVAVAVGSLGVTIAFSGIGLNAGDRFTIAVTAAKPGPYQTLILQDNLPTAFTVATDLAVKLYIRKNIQVTADRLNSPPSLNWSQDGNDVTVFAGMTAYDATYTSSGVQEPLFVVEGTLYIESRQWLQDNCNNVGTLTSLAAIVAALGVVDHDNPLAWGCNLALLNSSGSPVIYGNICGDPSLLASWTGFLDVITNLGGLYNIVPLTSLAGVAAAYLAHVTAQSVPEVGAFRRLWTNIVGRDTRPIVTQATTSDGTLPLCTISADPVTTLNTLVKVPAGNCKFISNAKVNPLEFPLTQTGSSVTKPAVQPGDIFRFQYTTDGFGAPVWTEYVVASVQNEDTLSLLTPTSVPFPVAQHFEIWHTMSKNNIVDDVLQQVTPLISARCHVVWPDSADGNPGYFVAAALAGEASGVATNQGMKNLQLRGFANVDRSMKALTAANRLKLAANGVWVVAQDALGNIYSQSACTTDVSSLAHQEEMINRNFDAALFYVINTLQQFVGVSNVVDGTLRLVRGQFIASITFMKNTNLTARLGPPVIDATIIELRQHTLLKDRIVITFTLTLPTPLNQVQLTAQVVL